MTDNTTFSRPFTATSRGRALAAQAAEAVQAAQAAHQERESQCTATSPHECLVLRFSRLSILPHVLLHTLSFPTNFKFSINSMATQEALMLRRQLIEENSQYTEGGVIIMDLRAASWSQVDQQ